MGVVRRSALRAKPAGLLDLIENVLYWALMGKKKAKAKPPAEKTSTASLIEHLARTRGLVIGDELIIDDSKTLATGLQQMLARPHRKGSYLNSILHKQIELALQGDKDAVALLLNRAFGKLPDTVNLNESSPKVTVEHNTINIDHLQNPPEEK